MHRIRKYSDYRLDIAAGKISDVEAITGEVTKKKKKNTDNKQL